MNAAKPNLCRFSSSLASPPTAFAPYSFLLPRYAPRAVLNLPRFSSRVGTPEEPASTEPTTKTTSPQSPIPLLAPADDPSSSSTSHVDPSVTADSTPIDPSITQTPQIPSAPPDPTAEDLVSSRLSRRAADLFQRAPPAAQKTLLRLAPAIPTTTELNEKKKKLEETFSQARRKIDIKDVVNKTKSMASRTKKAFDENTGYQAIAMLKERVIEKEKEYKESQKALEASIVKHDEASKTRSSLQRELNNLLTRKASWTDDELLRYTTLYRREHADEQAERSAADEHRTAEANVERARDAYVEAIRERYHEEQSWSDRVRATATYGTWALMGVNIFLFLLVQTVFEPRKREKLASRFDASMDRKFEEDRKHLDDRLSATFSTVASSMVANAGNEDSGEISQSRRGGGDEKVSLRSSPIGTAPVAMSDSDVEAIATVIATRTVDHLDSHVSRMLKDHARTLSDVTSSFLEDAERSKNVSAGEIASRDHSTSESSTPLPSHNSSDTSRRPESMVTKKDAVMVGVQGALFGCVVTGLVTVLFGR